MSHKINGRRAVRPGKNQKNPDHFGKLREQRIEMQGGRCATCPETTSLELHHAHYDTFGEEDINDVVILCRECHKAITNRIRAVTLDRFNVEPCAENSERSYRPKPNGRDKVSAITYEDERKLER